MTTKQKDIQIEEHIFASIEKKEDTLIHELNKIGAIVKNGNEDTINIIQFTNCYRLIPIIYSTPKEIEQQKAVNLLHHINLHEVANLFKQYEKYIDMPLSKLNLNKKQMEGLAKLKTYVYIYGLSKNDQYLLYLNPNYQLTQKINRYKIHGNKKKILLETERNINKTNYQTYNLESYFNEINENINKIKGMDIINFENITYEYGKKGHKQSITIPSPLNYINASTIVGISCQEVSPNGSKTIQVLDDPNQIISRTNRLKTEKRKPKDAIRAKMFELMLMANYNPYASFAMYDSRISFGHTQAIMETYYGLNNMTNTTKEVPIDFINLENQIEHGLNTKFFDIFDKDKLLNLETGDKKFLQLPDTFEECVSSKDQILFSYYLTLYNFTKFLKTIYFNPDMKMTNRKLLLINAYSNASEVERFKFVSSIAAAMHHMGESAPWNYFQLTLQRILPDNKNTKKVDELMNKLTLDDITNQFINNLKNCSSEHAKSSMNVAEIISKWYLSNELVNYTSGSTKLESEKEQSKIVDVLKNITSLLKTEKDNVIEVESGKASFECEMGKTIKLRIIDFETREDIVNHKKGKFVQHYVFSFPQWGSEQILLKILKDNNEQLLESIKTFNNIDTFQSTGDRNLKDPMQTAQIFWVPIDYMPFEGNKLGEINIPNNSRDKIITVLEKFCKDGATDENMKIIQLCSNIHSMYKPNDRLLIPLELLKHSARRIIEQNSK